ncbi:prohibitin family protein [Peribacillus sp. SCS-155]|uniref:prohibitin family protein n=1 Tax=Peribacillus sedimenti TaxID=3115297 RepID=UPI0039060995
MNRFKIGGLVIGCVLILTGVLTPLFIEKIAPGHVGVVYSPNGGVEAKTLGPGWHVVGFFKKVTEYPVRKQTANANNLGLATSDGKNVTIDFTYNYHVEPNKVVGLFNEFGPIPVEELEKNYMKSRLKDAARKVLSHYSVLELYGSKSGDVSIQVQETFADDVAKDGFIVEALTLGTPHPDKATQTAIDATVKAKQELERKKTEIELAKAEAERKKIEAQGNADAAIAKAEGDAKANKLLADSITPELIKLKEAEARLKHGWVTVTGAKSVITDNK